MVAGALVVDGQALVAGTLVVIPLSPDDLDPLVQPAATTKTMTTAMTILPLDTFQELHSGSCHSGRWDLKHGSAEHTASLAPGSREAPTPTRPILGNLFRSP